MKQTRAHRPLRRADDDSDLGARALFDLREHDDDALLERKSIEREHQTIGEHAALELSLRVVTLLLGLACKSSERSTSARRGPHVVLRMIDGDRDEERSQRAVITEAKDRL